MVYDNNIATIKFGKGKEITFYVDYVAQKDSSFEDEFDARRHNILTLKFGHKEATFDCWGRYINPSLEQEPERTMEIVLEDAIDYINAKSYEDFCQGNFSYNLPKAYEFCIETLNNLKRVGLSESDIFDLNDILKEKEENGTLDKYENNI